MRTSDLPNERGDDLGGNAGAVRVVRPTSLNQLGPVPAEWHVCISGFTQREGRMSGMLKLWQHLSSMISGPLRRVELRRWNEDWANFAEMIWLAWQDCGPGCEPPRVSVYAYSWGAGWGFLTLARELGKRGIQIDRAVLVDPVYRHRYWLGNWRAFWPLSTIRVPANVRRVTWFYQRKNLPAGHLVVAEDPTRTEVCAGIELADHTHQYMDDALSFHLACWPTEVRPCN